MRKLWLLLLTPLCAMAQSPVTVTATITGANGAPYLNGTYNVQLVNASGTPIQQATVSGTTWTQVQQSGTLTAAGALSVNLMPNANFLPSGTQWAFNICSASPTQAPVYIAGPYPTCYQALATITTAGSYTATISGSAPAAYYQDNFHGLEYSGVNFGSGFVGTGSVAFTAGAAAGASPGTPTCVASHVCDTSSGVISFTVGTSTTTGVLLTITLTPTTLRTNQGNCDGSVYLAASPYTLLTVRFTETTAPTTYVVNVGTAPTASTAYEIVYQCGGY